jgi:hypothetical protein
MDNVQLGPGDSFGSMSESLLKAAGDLADAPNKGKNILWAHLGSGKTGRFL